MVLYLDRYHLGDPLFLTRLGHKLASATEPWILVHGAAEHGERLLEAEGGIATWREDMLVVGSDTERAIVERAARDLNRRIAIALTDAGVAAVRVDGASRGLVRLAADGRLQRGDDGWLRSLVEQGVVPVVAALAPDFEGRLHQVPPGAMAASIADMVGMKSVLFLARRLSTDVPEARLEALETGALPEPAAVAAAIDNGADVLLVQEAHLAVAPPRTVRVLSGGPEGP